MRPDESCDCRLQLKVMRQIRVIGKPQIVVDAQDQQLSEVSDLSVDPWRRLKDALGLALPQTTDVGQSLSEFVRNPVGHGTTAGAAKMRSALPPRMPSTSAVVISKPLLAANSGS